MDEFHRRDYNQGAITSLPESDELAVLIKTGFRNSPLDYDRFIKVLERLKFGQGSRVYEFGCSWGYGAWQFSEYGYSCMAWDIDEHRMHYGKTNLGVSIRTISDIEEQSLDVFFSSHVIEHVPLPGELIRQAMTRLRAGGILFNATPNGSDTFRSLSPKSAHKIWGLVHPQLIDEAYLRQFASSDFGLIVTSALAELDVDLLKQGQLHVGDLSGDELYFIIRKRP